MEYNQWELMKYNHNEQQVTRFNKKDMTRTVCSPTPPFRQNRNMKEINTITVQTNLRYLPHNTRTDKVRRDHSFLSDIVEQRGDFLAVGGLEREFLLLAAH